MQPQALVLSVALTVVAAAGGFLSLLGFMALISPTRVKVFLLGFAATPARHFAELVVRVAVGLSFMLASPQLPGSAAFHAAGAVLVATTAAMALLPFKVHQAFAKRSVPAALAYLPLIGLASLAAGLFVTWSAYAASVA